MGRRPVVLGLALATALVIAVIGFWRGRYPSVRVTTVQVTAGPIQRNVLVKGTLQPAKIVNVGSQVSGKLLTLEADFNSSVRAGEIVARIDPALYRSALEAAHGSHAQATARATQRAALLADAQAKLQRAEELAAADLIPRAELESAQLAVADAAANVKVSRADVRGAEAEVRRAQLSLDQTIIRAPIDGIVINRNVEAGQTITATVESPVLFTIGDPARMHLLTEIDEAEVGGVQPGTTVSFEVESLGTQRFDGTVSEVRLQPYLAQTAVGATGAGASTGGSVNAPGSMIGATSLTPLSATASKSVATSGTSSSSAVTNSGAGSSSAQTGSARSGASPAPSANVATGAPTAPTAAGAVVYVALIEVNNPDGRLRPGGTAVVNLIAGHRPSAVRIPNTALTFRPAADVLEEIGQSEPPPAGAEQLPRSASDRNRRTAHVWRYERGRFTDIAIEIGLSDEQWTELVKGPLRPGDQLVTRAVLAR